MKINETDLKSSLKAGRLERAYLLYGKEPFLAETYADKIITAAAGEDPSDFDLIKLGSVPESPDDLSEYLEALPIFSPRKIVAVKDPDPESLKAEELKKLIDVAADVPESALLLFYCTNIDIDDTKAKAKKFIDAVDKVGAVCRFGLMTASKIAELCVKKAAKAGIVISRDDAVYLVERVGCHMNAASDETAKLMTYVGKGGTITREIIDTLVPKELDAVVFDLAGYINTGRRAEAYRMIDELDTMRVAPELIIGALAGAYIDLYGAKTAMRQGIPPDTAAPALGFYSKRVYAYKSKICPVAAKLSESFLRKSIKALYDADIVIKSTPVSKRTVIEQAVTKLFIARDSDGGKR